MYNVSKTQHIRSLSAHHAEVDGLMLEMSCISDQQILSAKFETDCADLVKMTEELSDMASFQIGVTCF